MNKRFSNVFTALTTAAALIAYVFYRRQGGALDVGDVWFYLAAAAITLAPVAWAASTHKCGKNRTQIHG